MHGSKKNTVNRSTHQGYNNSVSQGSTIISVKTGACLLLELFRTCRTGLLTSHAKIHVKRLAAECAASFGGLGGLQTLQNIVPEPDGTLIDSQPDVSTHRDAAQVLAYNHHPALRLEWYDPACRHAYWA